MRGVFAGLLVLVGGCAGAVAEPPRAPPPVVLVDRQIVTPDEGATAKELLRRGELALREERWQDAADAFKTLIAASKVESDPLLPKYFLELGFAEEGLGERAKARDQYVAVTEKVPASPDARTAWIRVISIDDYLEDWPALGVAATALLARPDLDDVDRLTGLGARGLSRIEAGDEKAMRDVQDGLDLVDKTRFGATGRLPNGAAQLRFALAEVRRTESEKIVLAPKPEDFLPTMEARCEGLMAAQSAYADAMRAMEPHWTAMSAIRIGVMYEKLHQELVSLPPPPKAKSKSQQDLFFAMMHVRYRVLLEKGLEMMKRTAALEAQSADVGPWVEKAKVAEVGITKAIDDEKAALAKLPYTEETVKAALDDLEKKTIARMKAREHAR